MDATAPFMLLCCMMYYVSPSLLAAYMLACAVHELGHILALRVCAARITALRLTGRGAVIEYAATGLTYLREVACALSGPAAGLAFGAGSLLIGRSFGFLWLRAVGGLSVALSAFNLLPVAPLDGGRALRSALSALLEEDRAGRWAGRISSATLALLAVLGALAAPRAGGWLPAAAVWLWAAAASKKLRVKSLWTKFRLHFPRFHDKIF